jgi:hypothetical protein
VVVVWPLMSLMLWLGPAWASDEPCPPAPDEDDQCVATPVDKDPGWVDLPTTPGDFGSALDALGTPPAEEVEPEPQDGASPPSPAEIAPAPERVPALLRDRWGVRPRISAVGRVGGQWGIALGGSVVHQWWAITERPLHGVGETRLDLSGRVGKIEGPDLRLTSVHGAWIGPVGLTAGGAARLDRYGDGTPELPLALTVGPQARLALKLGWAVPWGAFTPAWIVAGERPPAKNLDEWTAEGGVDLDGRPLTWRFSGALRETGTGRLWEAGFGLHLHL